MPFLHVSLKDVILIPTSIIIFFSGEKRAREERQSERSQNMSGEGKTSFDLLLIHSSDAYTGQCPDYQWILRHSYVSLIKKES